MNTDSALTVERMGHVLILSNNDAPLNRMSFEYMDALESALDAAAADPAVRVIVITAQGDANFSVGMDLKQLTLYAQQRGGLEAVLDQRRRVLNKIESMNKPSIATLFDAGIEETRAYLQTFMAERPEAGFFECNEEEAGAAFLNRFAVGNATNRYRAVHADTVEDVVALDIALPRNALDWF